MINEVIDRIKKVIEFLVSDELTINDTSYEINMIKLVKTKPEYHLKMIESFNWMMETSRNHTSLDIFAKKTFYKAKL